MKRFFVFLFLCLFVLSSGCAAPDTDTSLASVTANGQLLDASLSVTVSAETETLTLTVVPSSAKATCDVKSSYSLKTGENKISFTVTAESGAAKTYTVTAVRKDPDKDSDTSLASVLLNNTAYFPTENGFFLTVSADVTSAHLVPKPTSETASVEPKEADLTLNFGENTQIFTVTAEDGTKQEHRIVLVRQGDENADLASVSVNGTTLFPPDLTMTVKNSVTTVTISAKASSEAAEVSCPDSAELKVGVNEISLSVTSQTGEVRTYTLRITRKEKSKSGNAFLKDLTVRNGTLDEKISEAVTVYVATVPYTVQVAVIQATPQDSNATVSIRGNTSLSVGKNTFTIVVTAENGTQREYTLNIVRQKPWYENYDGTYGLDITNKTGLVSICYSTWHDYTTGLNSFREEIISEIAKTGGWSGDSSTFYFWGKPALGYYQSSDRTVIRTHMTQLAEAGVDFIIVDNTNLTTAMRNAGTCSNLKAPYTYRTMWDVLASDPLAALLEECAAMRKEGKKTPYIVLWNRGEDEGWKVTNAMYDKFFLQEKYKDLWVYWNKKPLFLTTNITASPERDITVRKMWGLQSSLGSKEWTFLQKNNTRKGSSNEQMTVGVAMQRTYMSNTATATGRNHGITFYNQWKNAFAAKPKVVTITWWNEWAAQRQPNGAFTDAYNTEYSRDIEPMSGGHGDQYYQWMKQYIAAYKAGKSCPRLVESGY